MVLSLEAVAGPGGCAGRGSSTAAGPPKLSAQGVAVPGAPTSVPAGDTHWMCLQQTSGLLGAPQCLECHTLPDRHIRDSTCRQKASERHQLPRKQLLGPAQTPLSRWWSCPRPAQDQDSPLRKMGTLCGIWFWEHCLVYSLARDLQGRFAEAWHTSDMLGSLLLLLSLLHLPTRHPSACGPRGVSPLPTSPQVASKDGTSQEVFTCLCQ